MDLALQRRAARVEKRVGNNLCIPVQVLLTGSKSSCSKYHAGTVGVRPFSCVMSLIQTASITAFHAAAHRQLPKTLSHIRSLKMYLN